MKADSINIQINIENNNIEEIDLTTKWRKNKIIFPFIIEEKKFLLYEIIILSFIKTIK